MSARQIKLQRLVRPLALRALRAVGSDIWLRHHWVPGRRFKLHSFKHKGYWWHGRHREEATMTTLAKLISPGQTVIELGAHIGYLTIYFAHLVGRDGKVIAFEPSSDTLDYLGPNIAGLGQATIEPIAISDFTGEADLFVEDLTGQNTSLVENYSVLERNAANAGLSVHVTRSKVPVTTLDQYCQAHELAPDFIKIDVEGAEESVLRGAGETLRKHRPIVLVEITREHERVSSLLRDQGYECFDDTLKPAELVRQGTPNYFWIPTESVEQWI